MTNRDQVTVVLPAELRAALQAAAEQERRPLSNLMRNVLADWAAHRQQAQGAR